MKDVRAADWLRRLQTKQSDWATKVHRLALTSVPSIGTIEIPILSPLTVLAGPNGVGKTTLLRAMWAALEPNVAEAVVTIDKKLISGNALVDLSNAGYPEVAEVSFIIDEVKVISRTATVIQHVDSATHTPIHRKGFCAFGSAEEIVNGSGSRKLDSQALAEVNHILHRAYRSVTLYEVEMDGLVPFFEVTYGDDRYDSRTMGAGEMSALYLWWAVNRAERNSILLLEEPEAFLSFGCQQSLTQFLVKSVVQKHLVAILSSHSSAFISTLPKDSLVFLTRGQTGITVVSDQPPPVLLKAMGIAPPITAVVLVEDSMAHLFCRSILEKFDPFLSRQLFIEQRNGDGGIRNTLKPMLGSRSPIKFVGLFDGDLRGAIHDECAQQSTFLPGTAPVEVLFKDMVADNPNLLVEAVDHAHVLAVVAALEGKDHHDWYEELARELGLSKDQLFANLFAIWIKIPENEAAAVQTYTDLNSLLNRQSV